MSPHRIEVLFHHHVSGAPWPRGNTPSYIEDRRWLFSNGLIDREDDLAATTDRGKVLVAMICATPLPVSVYVDPRTNREVKP